MMLCFSFLVYSDIRIDYAKIKNNSVSNDTMMRPKGKKLKKTSPFQNKQMRLIFAESVNSNKNNVYVILHLV